MNEKAFPITWPKDWPRTKAPGKSQFKTSLAGALNNVEDSIKRFSTDSGKRIENLLISSNFSLGTKNPADTGVAIYFTWDGISTCIAVDRYSKIEDNLQAIHHVLEAERTKLRHGGLNLVRAAFRGYAALPPPGKRNWHEVLGVRSDAPLSEIEEAYKRRAKDAHPDNGGTHDRMSDELNVLIEQ